jgi:hypothetical protein
MGRWILAVVLAMASAAACHTSPSDGGGIPDAGDESGCPCVVMDPDAGTSTTIPCAQITCVNGTDYLCGRSGAVSAEGPCLPTGDASFPDACKPTCALNACDTPDGCGGICHCSGSVLCVGGTCGDGCTGVPGDYCDPVRPDGSAPTTCCGAGYACNGVDGGITQCCSITGQGPCGTDTDCCDYPAVHCNQIDAGPDSGVLLVHVCN